jgi:hypothetical protein
MSGSQTLRVNNQHLARGENRIPANGVAVPSGFARYDVGLDLAGWAITDEFSISILFKPDDGNPSWSNAIVGVSASGLFGGSWTNQKTGTSSTVHSIRGDFPQEFAGTSFLAQVVITAPKVGNVDALIVLS